MIPPVLALGAESSNLQQTTPETNDLGTHGLNISNTDDVQKIYSIIRTLTVKIFSFFNLVNHIS